jgi:Ni/Co efflux regulator RcnB
MRYTQVVSTLMAMTLSLGGLSFAQGGGYRDDHRDNRRNDFNQDRGQYHGHQERSNNDGRPDRPSQWEGGSARQFHRGQRLAPQYRQRVYVVNDWRSHNLRSPPRGHHWVQIGGDYVLVAIATGVIVELLLNH